MAHGRHKAWVEKRKKKERDLPKCYQAKKPSKRTQDLMALDKTSGLYTPVED